MTSTPSSAGPARRTATRSTSPTSGRYCDRSRSPSPTPTSRSSSRRSTATAAGYVNPSYYTPCIHPLYTFIAVYAPMDTRYTCIYTIYTPNTPLYTLYTPYIHPIYTPYTPYIHTIYTPAHRPCRVTPGLAVRRERRRRRSSCAD